MVAIVRTIVFGFGAGSNMIEGSMAWLAGEWQMAIGHLLLVAAVLAAWTAQARRDAREAEIERIIEVFE